MIVGFWIILLTLAFQFSLVGQDYERIAPKTLPKNEESIQLPFQSPIIEGGDDKVIVKTLKAIVLLNHQDEVRKEGIPEGEGVRGFGIGPREKFALWKQFDRYWDQPVTLKSLNSLTRELVLFYRQNDQPVINVILPEQDITSGVVQLLVLEGRLGHVKAEENRWFASKALEGQVRLRSGEIVGEKRLTEDLEWLNENPFRQVNAIFTPGQKTGETDLILKTKDRFPVRFYTGYEDSGNDLTGDERILAGVNWGNAFGLDHQLNYQITGDGHFNKLLAHSGSYMVPLPWRHRLAVFGSYVTSHADTPNPLIELKGKSFQVSGRYTIPLMSFDPYKHEFTVGADFKQSNNNLEFGGARVFNTTTDIAQCVLDYSSSVKDPFGKTTFDASLFYSPGDLTRRNRALDFQAARNLATPNYKYARFSLEHLTRLPWDFTWTIKAGYQVADGNLLGSEQMGLGGYSTIRGYDEREANGDGGYLVSTEIRTPPISLAPLVNSSFVKDQFQFLGFFDYGTTENHTLLLGEDPHIQLASIGPGIRYSISPYLSLRFDYGWQLYNTGLNSRNNSRGHLGIVLAY